MSDHSEIKRLADACPPPGAYHYQSKEWAALMEFQAAVEDVYGSDVGMAKALIAENERLQGCEDVLRQLAIYCGTGGYNASEVDPETFAKKIMDGISILNDPLAQLAEKRGAERDKFKTEVEGFRAQHGRDSAELRSLCQARDDARKERDSLKAEVKALRSKAKEFYSQCEKYDAAIRSVVSERGALKAEIEALRKDAERYRFLRHDISNPVQDFCIIKKYWDGTFPDRILELDGADTEIDAAIGDYNATN